MVSLFHGFVGFVYSYIFERHFPEATREMKCLYVAISMSYKIRELTDATHSLLHDVDKD